MMGRYFLTIVDDMSRSTWVYLLKNKSDTQRSIESFYNLVNTQFGTRIKYLRSDNGTEFQLTDFYRKNGIIHQKTCVKTPQQNGIVERKHQHILNVVRAIRFQANLPLDFWNDCVLTATYLINRIPTPLLQNTTPYVAIFKHDTTYDHLRVFGCLCFATTLSQGRRKFDSRARRCIFLGYPFWVKGYKLLDLETNDTFLSKNVTFHKYVFPFHTPATFSSDPISPLVQQQNQPCYSSTLDPLSTIHTSFDPITHISCSPSKSADLSLTTAILPKTCDTSIPSHHSPSGPSFSDYSHSPISTSSSPPHIPIRKSGRMTQAPKYLQDFHYQLVSLNSPNPIQATTVKVLPGKQFPLSNFLSYTQFSLPFQVFAASISSHTEPQTYAQVVLEPHWRTTMQNELEALESNQTWILTDLPPGKRPIDCKYAIRLNTMQMVALKDSKQD